MTKIKIRWSIIEFYWNTNNLLNLLLFSADATGTSDPFIIGRCAGKTAYTSIKEHTLNPDWYETLYLNVSLPAFPTKLIKPGIFLVVFDSDINYN